MSANKYISEWFLCGVFYHITNVFVSVPLVTPNYLVPGFHLKNRTHNRVVICRVVSGTPQVNNNAPKLDRAIDPGGRRGRGSHSRHNLER